MGDVIAYEEKYCSLPPDPNQIAAGIDRFKELGSVVLVDSLANGDITKWQQIENMSLGTIHAKMRMNVLTHQFKQEYEFILNPHKRNTQ